MLNHRAYPPFFLYSGPLIHIPIVLLKSLCKQPGWFLNLWVMKRSWLWSRSVLRIWIPSPSGPTNYPCSDSYIHPHKCMARFLRISLLLNYDNSPPMCWDKSLLCFIPLCCTFCHLPGSWPEITSLLRVSSSLDLLTYQHLGTGACSMVCQATASFLPSLLFVTN